MYANVCGASNSNFGGKLNSFDFGKTLYSELQDEKSQDHRGYSDKDYQIGMKNVFGRGEYSQEPVGKVFFSAQNIKRIQKMIKNEVYTQTNHQFILEENQDTSDLLIAMRAIYKMYCKFINSNIIHQVKILNKKLVSYVVPDMITEIKQYYGYIKEINEPLKPIDRPMNVSNAGRRTLPSVTSMWTL